MKFCSKFFLLFLNLVILSEGEEIESVNKYREPFAVGQLCSIIFIFFQRFLILTQRLQQFCVPFAKEKSGKFNKIYLHEKTTTQKVFNKSSRVIYDCRSNCKLAVTNYIHLEMVVLVRAPWLLHSASLALFTGGFGVFSLLSARWCEDVSFGYFATLKIKTTQKQAGGAFALLLSHRPARLHRGRRCVHVPLRQTIPLSFNHFWIKALNRSRDWGGVAHLWDKNLQIKLYKQSYKKKKTVFKKLAILQKIQRKKRICQLYFGKNVYF